MIARNQRGATLLVALVMLILLLMLAVTGMRAITVETRIAANLLQYQQMFETADGTLRDGERAIIGTNQGVALRQCAEDSALENGHIPCYTSAAKTDPIGLNTDFSLSTRSNGFSQPYGFWYIRYIDTVCPKGLGATSALRAATTGCTEYYEVNAQASATESVSECGDNALCLRSTVNQFIK